METIESKVINDWLKLQGQVPLKTDPIFRLVWTTEQFEVRRGSVDIYHANIKVATKEVIEKLPKYSWMPDRWLLEMWQPADLVYTPEIPDTANGSYEPVYAFQNSKGDPLPLNMQVTQLLVCRLTRPASTAEAIKSRIKMLQEIKEAKIDEYVFDAIDPSPMASLLHHGEAGQVPSNFDVPSPNLRNKND